MYFPLLNCTTLLLLLTISFTFMYITWLTCMAASKLMKPGDLCCFHCQEIVIFGLHVPFDIRESYLIINMNYLGLKSDVFCLIDILII